MSHATDPIAAPAGRVLAGEDLDRTDLLRLVEVSVDRPHDLLYWAHRVRASRFGNAVRLCSIVAGKLGGCGEDCKWCAQSGRAAPGGVTEPTHTPRRVIVNAAVDATKNHAAGIGIVNSGRRPSRREFADVLTALNAVRDDPQADIGLCASLGELTDDQARQLAVAGLTHYNHNIETSRRMYARMVSTHSFDDRLATLDNARNAGIKLCCGGIFGLGETWDDRIDMALTLRHRVRPTVVPLNFLNPIPGTPLASAQPLEPMEILRIIAIFRLAMPTVDIKLAGGRELNLRDMQSWAFHAGATSTMVGNYLTTTGRSAAQDLQMLKDLGLTIVRDLPACPPPPETRENPSH